MAHDGRSAGHGLHSLRAAMGSRAPPPAARRAVRHPLAAARRPRRRDRLPGDPSPTADPALLPIPGEAAARERLVGVGGLGGPARLRGRPEPPRRRRHVAAVRRPQVRDALAAGGAAGGRRAGRRASRLRVRALLARVLLARALALPARGPGRVPASVRRRPVDRRPGRPGGLAGGPHRLPGRGRRDAPARSERLDAQSGPDDRGELPRQGPPDRLAARRSPLHGPPRRRRRRRQQRRLAVDRRDRDGRGALLPGLQPGRPGSPLRSRRAPTSGAGCRSWPASRTRTSTSRGRCRPACRVPPAASSAATTRPRSSTTPRRGSGPSPPTVSPGRAKGSCRGPGIPSARRASGRRPTSAGRRGGAPGSWRRRRGRPSPRVPPRGRASGGACRR